MSTNWSKRIGWPALLLILAALGIGAYEMAPRGPGPSWNRQEQPIVEAVVDLGELASRQLLGFGSFSRAGRWLFATGFEDGLQGFLAGGAAITNLTDEVYQGAQAVKMTTGIVAEDEAKIIKYFMPPEGYMNGTEIMISLFGGDVASYGLQIVNDPGGADSQLGKVRIYLNGAERKLQYAIGSVGGQFPSGTWVDLKSLPNISKSANVWHNLKLVVDFENDRYAYAILDGIKHPIDADLASQPSLYDGHQVRSYVYVVTHEAVEKSALVDNFIINAEPIQ